METIDELRSANTGNQPSTAQPKAETMPPTPDVRGFHDKEHTGDEHPTSVNTGHEGSISKDLPRSAGKLQAPGVMRHSNSTGSEGKAEFEHVGGSPAPDKPEEE